MERSFANNFIGETITSLSRVTLENEDFYELNPKVFGNQEPFKSMLLDATLVFKLATGTRFELLVRQSDYLFEEILIDQPLLAGFELDPCESISLSDTESMDATFPLSVASTTELWASFSETKFLVAVIFWNEHRKPLLSICTETDEVEILQYQQLVQRIMYMPFHYGHIEITWYDNKAPLQKIG